MLGPQKRRANHARCVHPKTRPNVLSRIVSEVCCPISVDRRPGLTPSQVPDYFLVFFRGPNKIERALLSDPCSGLAPVAYKLMIRVQSCSMCSHGSRNARRGGKGGKGDAKRLRAADDDGCRRVTRIGMLDGYRAEARESDGLMDLGPASPS
jgi:hypothetical protein